MLLPPWWAVRRGSQRSMGVYCDTPGTESGKPAGCRVYRYGLRLARSQGEPVAAVHKTNRRRTNLIPKSVHRRFVHLTTRIRRYYTLAWATSVPMLGGLI